MTMKNYIKTIIAIVALIAGACSYPIDDKGLLITSSTASYMTMFDLLDESHATVIIGKAALDTITDKKMGIVTATVKYGTNLKILKPYCSVVTEATVAPMMGVWTDFSDLVNPKIYTVISGNRLVQRPYKIVLSVQPKP